MAKQYSFLLMVLLLVCNVVSAEPNADTPFVRYSKRLDKLTILAKDASITTLLRHVALSTGLDVRVNPAVEQRLTIEIKEKPLEPALHDLLRGYNTLYIYADKTTGKASLLIAIRVLPNGVNDDSQAVALSSPEAEALSYAQAQVIDPVAQENTPMRPAQIDYLESRWQYRIQQLPLDQRLQLETLMENHKEFLFAQREKIQRMHQQTKNDDDKRRLANESREKELFEADRQRYALREQRRQQLMRTKP